jgi:hypothetical protein
MEIEREQVIKLMEMSIQRGIQLKNDLKVIHKKDHIDKWIEKNIAILEEDQSPTLDIFEMMGMDSVKPNF